MLPPAIRVTLALLLASFLSRASLSNFFFVNLNKNILRDKSCNTFNNRVICRLKTVNVFFKV